MLIFPFCTVKMAKSKDSLGIFRTLVRPLNGRGELKPDRIVAYANLVVRAVIAMKMNGFVPASRKRFGGQTMDRFTDLDALVELSQVLTLLMINGDNVFFQLVQRPRPLVKDIDEALYQGYIVAALKCNRGDFVVCTAPFDKR